MHELQRDLLLGEEQLHEVVAVHRERLEHLTPGGLGGVLQVGGDIVLADDLALLAVEVEGLHADQVDHAPEVLLLADGQLHQHRVGAELLPDLLDHRLGVGARAVHLVDEGQAGDVVALHLPVDGHRLRLHAAHGAEHQHRPVEHAQRSLHLDGEVDVARGVDQVDLVPQPADAGRGAGDGDAALLLQLHVVHGGAVAAAADVLDLVDPARVVKDALAERRLAGVDVGGDADVA